MATDVTNYATGELGGLASSKSGVTSLFNGGTFTGVDPDEQLVPAESGALGVINPDVTGPAQVGGSSGPAAGR